jgi:hypothetical protein
MRISATPPFPGGVDTAATVWNMSDIRTGKPFLKKGFPGPFPKNFNKSYAIKV